MQAQIITKTIATPNLLVATDLNPVLKVKGSVLKKVRLDLDPMQSADLQVMIAGSILDQVQAEYEASLSQKAQNFGSAQNGLEIITEAKLGVLVAVQEGAYPSPASVEEITDLFVEGCVELSQVAEILPKRGQNVVTRQLVKGVKMIRRVGAFFC